MKSLYCGYVKCLKFLQSIFLLIIRLYWGWSFFTAGRGKFANMEKTIGFFTSLNIPHPQANATLVASVETFCGLLLLAGLMSRIITVPLIIAMTVALLTAHADVTHALFADPDTFFSQEPFLFLYASVIVWLFGPGKISLDYLLCKLTRRNHE